MSKHALVVGTRGSALALWQAEHVVERLRASVPPVEAQVKRITTYGDRVRDRALSQVGGRGLFVKEIEHALLAGEVDLAVHSLKDMPTELPDGLMLGAILERADPRDALVSGDGTSTLSTLLVGATIGTSSLRRRAQLLAARADLEVVDLRGNVGTRLRKLRDGDCDAVVLAVAGLVRLGHAGAITQYLPLEVMLPAVGQGALCVEVRAGDSATRAVVARLDHRPTHQAALAERAFLRRLEGGCQVPVGAYAEVDGDQLDLQGLVALPDGASILRDEIQGEAAHAARLGQELAERMLAAGGRAILEEVRRGQ
jgi:hydroxymethylbilane synthase